MQASRESVEAYLHWLSDRGIQSPVRKEVERQDVTPPVPRVVFVGDVERASEERQLLDKMIHAMRLTPSETLVTPASALLNAQLRKARPEFVIALGVEATKALLGDHAEFESLRGKIVQTPELDDLLLLATFHPRDLIKFNAHKRQAWSDLQQVMTRLGLDTKA